MILIKIKLNNLNLVIIKLYNFYKNEDIIFTTEDGCNTYIKYKNNNNNMIIFDPPYMMSFNDFYLDGNLNIYEYLYENNILSIKAKIYLILEKIWIVMLLFNIKKNYISYDKTYSSIAKRKTEHIIISNIKEA